MRMLLAAAVLVASAAPAAAQAPAPAPAGPDLKALEKTCEKSAVAADCMTLAGMHLRGEGAPRDAGKAADFYKKACDLGTAQGCFELASMHVTGQGAKKDVTRAV